MHLASSNARPAARTRRFLLLAAAPLLLGGCQLAKDFYENLSIYVDKERTGQMRGGLQVGEWTYYYPSGALKAKGSYAKDKQTGPWTYWHENDNVEWTGEFDGAYLSGPTFFGYENGKRRAVGMFMKGLEEDLWTYWNEDGSLHCEGDRAGGTPVLRWTYYAPDGSVLAEGYRLDGERVGPWHFYGQDGKLSERRFPLPAGVEIVHETWDDGTPRREGFLRDGVPDGRWVTWHPSGARRATGDFENGRPSGRWLLWEASGQPLARGWLLNGRAVGRWKVARGGVMEDVSGLELGVEPVFDGAWSRSGSSGGSPEHALASWIGEAASPVSTDAVVDARPDPDTPSPPAELVEATAEVPTAPMRAQPWTVREKQNLEFLVARYTDGAANVRPARQSGYGRRTSASRPKSGDPELSPRFLGQELPWTRFYRAQGDVVDLDDFRGKKKVVLTVLRGTARDVCVYCVTQTEALCDNIEAFEEEGCEVFVVSPGARNRFEMFKEGFERESKYGEPPLGLLYDQDMRLVELMGIQAEFAIPSTFVIDESGVIRYSYVGRDIEDRPPARDVLEAIRKLPSS